MPRPQNTVFRLARQQTRASLLAYGDCCTGINITQEDMPIDSGMAVHAACYTLTAHHATVTEVAASYHVMRSLVLQAAPLVV
jgi:hypothetical protein